MKQAGFLEEVWAAKDAQTSVPNALSSMSVSLHFPLLVLVPSKAFVSFVGLEGGGETQHCFYSSIPNSRREHLTRSF